MPIRRAVAVLDASTGCMTRDLMLRVFEDVLDCADGDLATAYVVFPWAMKVTLEQHGFSFSSRPSKRHVLRKLPPNA